jgi:oligosaccharide 4-alpha-D-glucosyltransferase
MQKLISLKSMLLSLFVWASISSATAQNPLRKFGKIDAAKDKVSIHVNDGVYQFVFYNESIVHATFFPEQKPLKRFSYAVAVEPFNPDYKMDESAAQINIRTKNLHVQIIKNPFQIRYFDKSGNLLISENKGYNELEYGASLNFIVSPDELFYGGGARVLGMNRRGHRLQLYNKAHYGYETHSELMNYTLPAFISSKRYSVLFDNASAGYLDLDSKKDNNITYESVSGTMNYFVIAGNNWYDLVNQYTWLTGYQPLPPRWAFGNFSSRFGYHSQKETEGTVERFFADSIPLDAVIIDIYWFGKDIKGHMGNLEWFRDSFPDPDGMLRKFKDKGIKTILVTEPFVLTTSKKWNEVAENKLVGLDSLGNPYTFDFYFGNSGLIDLYKPEAREWFWNIYKTLTIQGVDGWWGDLGEPEAHPSGLLHAIGNADEIHNAYGHEWAKLIFEGYQKDFPDIRPFILMRAGYAGSQRYGMIPWTGDVGRSWGGLVPQPEISLTMGMQGLAYMHSDLGGFAGGEVFDPELYTRWLQYGVFQPVYRPHAQEHIPAEPVFHDEKTKSFARKSIQLRYKLIPYIYNMAFENSTLGKPFMIPLFFNEPDNSILMTYDKAYMWGDAFLVSPVKSKGQIQQQIYFPKGYNWYHFFENTQFKGGKNYTVDLKQEHIPVFVKGGSFVPLMGKPGNTEKYSLESFELHYYLDPLVANSTYRMYNDDGKTPDAFEKSKYEMFSFGASNRKSALRFDFAKQSPYEPYKNSTHNVEIIVHNLKSKPKEIKVNGIRVNEEDFKWDIAGKRLKIMVSVSEKNTILEILK